MDIQLNNLFAPVSVIFLNITEFETTENYICRWSFDDGSIIANCAALIEHIYTEADCYEPYLVVMKSDMPECRDTAFISPCINVIDNSGIDDDYLNASQFSLFPNPASESFSVTCDDTEMMNILVSDINGKTLINIPGYRGQEINIKNLNSGIYFIKIQSSQTTICKKLLVK